MCSSFQKQIFTAAQHLADVFCRLNQAGNLLFSEWRCIVYCSRKRDGSSVKVSFGKDEFPLFEESTLSTELQTQRQFMITCLKEWYQHIEEKRMEYSELNYFTTTQLVLLRQSLTKLALTLDDESAGAEYDLHHQVYVLLSMVKYRCGRDDVISALRTAKSAMEKLQRPLEKR